MEIGPKKKKKLESTICISGVAKYKKMYTLRVFMIQSDKHSFYNDLSALIFVIYVIFDSMN